MADVVNTAAGQRVIRLISFGYLHAPAPQVELVVDVRRYLRDPAAAASILERDGRDSLVQATVLGTPGAAACLSTLACYVIAFPAGHDCVIAIGCAGGRHRSVALVELLAAKLRAAGPCVEVSHLHAHLPRVLRTAAADG